LAVYVDDMKAPYRGMLMCHMVGDTDEEVHAMAARIGIARRWYQGDHYDISLGKRALAVQYGAREITMRQLGCMVANKRVTGSLGDPETAVALRRTLRAEMRAARTAGDGTAAT